MFRPTSRKSCGGVAIFNCATCHRAFRTLSNGTAGLIGNSRCGSHEPVKWSRPFTEPIELPNGKKLITLRDAAVYITKLPKAEHDADDWQAAMEALILVAEQDDPTMFARIGVMRAIHRHVEREFDTSRKDHRWGRRKLARDSMIEVGKYRGVDADGVAKTEADHFGNCPVCGAFVDMRDLGQVLAHVHDAEFEICEGSELPLSAA
jgi:hypothetical protein